MNYLDFEYELYETIFKEAKCLWKSEKYSSVYLPSYFESKGAKFLSYKIKAFFDISNLTGIEGQVKELHKLYLENYAGNKHKTKRFPERFPRIINIEDNIIKDATIRYEDAFSSQKLMNIKDTYPLGLLNGEQLKALKHEFETSEIKVHTKRITNTFDSFVPSGNIEYQCFLSKKELIDKFGQDSQIRRKTGTRFKTTLQTENNSLKSNVGFFLFNQSFNVHEINFPLRKRKSAVERVSVPGFPGIQISLPTS